MAGVVSPLLNRGVRSEWLSALPGATSMLVVTSAGVVETQAIPGSGVTDHGALSGLSDDDHSQYFNASRLATALADYLTTAAAAAGYQPLDSDLTAIAALSTTAFGRALLTLADAAAARSAIGAGTGDALTTNPLSQFAATTSAQLRGVLSDETGTGALVFAGGNIGAATGASLSLTGSISFGAVHSLVSNGSGSIKNVIGGSDSTLFVSSSSGVNHFNGYIEFGGGFFTPRCSMLTPVAGTVQFRQGDQVTPIAIDCGLVSCGTYTVGTLPSASANAGRLAQVTDSSVTTNGSAVAGGGSNRTLVYSNGTSWDVVAA